MGNLPPLQPVFFLYHHSRLVGISPAIEQFTGFSSMKIIAAGDLGFIFPVEQQAEWTQRFQAFQAQQQSDLAYEMIWTLPHGERRWLEIALHRQALVDKANIYGTITDITERKQRDLLQESQRLLTDGLHQTLVLLNHDLDISTIFTRIMVAVGQLVPHETANLMLIEDGIATLVASYRYDEYQLTQWAQGLHMRLTNFPNLLKVYQTGQAQIVPDTTAHPDWHPIPETHWIQSALTVPIHLGHEVIGFINLDSAQKNRFSADQVHWLQIFADQAAAVLKVARLFAEERAQRQFAEALSEVTAAVNSASEQAAVLQIVTEKARQIMPASDTSGLIFFEGDTFRLAHYHYTELSPEAMLQVEQQRSPLVMLPWNIREKAQAGEVLIAFEPDPAWESIEYWNWVQAMLCAPIQVDGATIGVLIFASRQPFTYSVRHSQRLMTLAAQAATAIKKARLYADLEHERARLQSILDATHEGICYIRQGQIIFANQGLTRLLGYTLIEVTGKPFAFYWESYHKNELLTLAEQALQRGESWHYDLRLRRQDGSFVTVAYSLSRIGEAAEQRMVAVMRDISQEQQLRSRQTRFITNAAHELRHPLTRLLNRLYLMRRQPDQIDEHLEVLQSVGHDMTRLIGDMAEFIQLEQGYGSMNPTLFALETLLPKVIERHHTTLHQHQISVEINAAPSLPTVRGDQVMTTHLLDKLLYYAITQTPDQGAITLDLRLEDKAVICRLAYQGTALPPRQLERIFDPFFQPSEGARRHSGLELSIARQIARLHRWELTAENTCGFLLRVPG